MTDSNAQAFQLSERKIPSYLEDVYWWAYVRPWAVWIFEREWLVNVILWGFYRPLRDLVLRLMGDDLSGKTLKISCCYGGLEPMLAAKVQKACGHLDILDIAPEQLKNAQRKLKEFIEAGYVSLHHLDAVDLPFETASYDRALIFFLPHEQPEDIRRKTFEEALRVIRPGGALYIAEFGKARWWHPLRPIWYPVLYVLEPFARDLWAKPLSTWLPRGGEGMDIRITRAFGDYYQVVEVTAR